MGEAWSAGRSRGVRRGQGKAWGRVREDAESPGGRAVQPAVPAARLQFSSFELPPNWEPLSISPSPEPACRAPRGLLFETALEKSSPLLYSLLLCLWSPFLSRLLYVSSPPPFPFPHSQFLSSLRETALSLLYVICLSPPLTQTIFWQDCFWNKMFRNVLSRTTFSNSLG